MVSSGPFIDGSVVLYWSEFSIFLFDEEKVGGVGAPGFSYGASLQVLLDEVMDFLDFFLIKRQESSWHCRWGTR